MLEMINTILGTMKRTMKRTINITENFCVSVRATKSATKNFKMLQVMPSGREKRNVIWKKAMGKNSLYLRSMR